MAALGSSAHRAIIEQIVARYRDDDRVRAVAVFGSVATGAWHELSDVDLDVVISDYAAVRPADEVAALFGPAAAITLTRADSADVVLDSLEEVSIRSIKLIHPQPSYLPRPHGEHPLVGRGRIPPPGMTTRIDNMRVPLDRADSTIQHNIRRPVPPSGSYRHGVSHSA